MLITWINIQSHKSGINEYIFIKESEYNTQYYVDKKKALFSLLEYYKNVIFYNKVIKKVMLYVL